MSDEQSAKNAHSFDEQLDAILAKYEIGFVVGDKHVNGHIAKFKQAINQAVKDHIIADIIGMCLETKHPGELPSVDALMIRDKPKRGRPTEIKRDITKTSQSGLREGLTRATFIIREDTLDKLKERAYTDRKKLKDLVSEALDYYLDNYKETKIVLKYLVTKGNE